MIFRHGLRHGQADSKAAGLVGATGKAPRQMFQLLRFHIRHGILHRDFDISSLPLYPDLNGAGGRNVFKCIVQQYVHHFPNGSLVPAKGNAGGDVHLEVFSAPRRDSPEGFADLPQGIGQREIHFFHLFLLFFQPGEVHQALSHVGHTFRLQQDVR